MIKVQCFVAKITLCSLSYIALGKEVLLDYRNNFAPCASSNSERKISYATFNYEKFFVLLWAWEFDKIRVIIVS